MAERDPNWLRNRPAPKYREDYAAWLAGQIELLRQRRFDEVDLENLLDEVSDLGSSDFKGFVSAIEIVIAHMLKWDHQAERRSNSWIASIEEHRSRIDQDLADSPSYHSRLEEATRRAYRPARAIASRETGLPLKVFPEQCPYDWSEIVRRDHLLGD